MTDMKLFKKTNDCTAVIVAAGSSTRMGTDKTFLTLGGCPVILRTLRVFEASPEIGEIIVVTRRESLEKMAELVSENSLKKVKKIIEGGKTRSESVLAGVSAAGRKAKLIAVHDGARPFVTEELIAGCVGAAAECGAAVPGIAVTDTLKQAENGFISGEADRDSLFRIQTPQVFQADLLKGALTNAVGRGLTLTDDSSAAVLMGMKVKLVPGDEDNIKLTGPKDLRYGEFILRERGES